MTRHYIAQLTDNFVRNLEGLEAFLTESGVPNAFDALLDDLTDTVIPNLQRFPGMGPLFLERTARSVEVANGMARLNRQLGALAKDSALREYVMTHYILLYALIEGTIYLLSIRHQRQFSCDFRAPPDVGWTLYDCGQ